MKRSRPLAVAVALLILFAASPCFPATITKGLIGEQDLNKYDGATSTFARSSSTGGTVTLTKIGYEVDVLMTYGKGTSYAKGTITAALAAVGTTNKATLLLRPGTWTITDDLTIPANVTLKVVPGAVLAVSTAKTLTINGPLEAGLYQVFSLTGTGAVVGLAVHQGLEEKIVGGHGGRLRTHRSGIAERRGGGWIALNKTFPE